MLIPKSVTLRVSLYLVTAAWPGFAAESLTGRWMIDTMPVADQVQLTLHRGDGHSNSTSSFSIGLASLRGVTRAQIDSNTGQLLRFEIARDAGTLSCEGYFKSGNGAGAFSFTVNPSFLADMRSLGYGSLSTETVFAMALHDVGPAYVRELNAAGLSHLTVDNLISMRIHGVSADFIRELKTLGYRPSADELVSMRIHGVTPEYIHDLRARGLKDISIDQLVSLKIHGISD